MIVKKSINAYLAIGTKAHVHRHSLGTARRFLFVPRESPPLKKEPPFRQNIQADSGFRQGLYLVLVGIAYNYLTPVEFQAQIIIKIVDKFRELGLKRENINDKQLIREYFEKNIYAAQNVVIASPSFYFMWHYIHGTPLATSFFRSITGTLRIVPFMGIFYGGFALVAPWVTSMFIDRGQTYSEAHTNTSMVLFLTGFAPIEGVVELRGCGVPFSSMSPMSILLFTPAVIGRLAAGVITQQAKIGKEGEVLLPLEWKTSESTWKNYIYIAFEFLALDKDFITSVVGTSIFQHGLNGVTYVLLNKGKDRILRDFLRYLGGGISGTRLGAIKLFGSTVALRTCFCWTWNFCSSQKRKLESIELALEHIE